MTDAERERAQKWFEENFVGNACILCTRLSTLKLGNILSIIDTSLDDTTWHPYITVECSVCGHTLFYNAVTIGVLKLKE